MAFSLQDALDDVFNAPNELEDYIKNVFQNKTQYQVRVLSTPRPYSSDTDGNVTVDGPKNTIIFKGRILDAKMPHQKFLSDPCDPSIINSSNLKAYSKLVSLHSNVILTATEDDCCSLSVGDVVLAELESGFENIYDIQNIYMVGVEFSLDKSGGTTISANCASLIEDFEKSARTLPGTIGNSSTSNPTYTRSQVKNGTRGFGTLPNSPNGSTDYQGNPDSPITFDYSLVGGEGTSTLSEAQKQFLEQMQKYIRKKDIPNPIVLTSTTRTSETQARLVFEKFTGEGYPSTLQLYGGALQIQELYKVYQADNADYAGGAAVLDRMGAISSHQTGFAFDFGVGNMTWEQADYFTHVANSLGHSNTFYEVAAGTGDHIHATITEAGLNNSLSNNYFHDLEPPEGSLSD